MEAVAEGIVAEHLGDYRLDEQLRRDGTTMLYRAQRLDGARGAVALRVLPSSNPETEAWRAQEKRLLELQHPNVARVLHVGEADGRFYVARELLEGCTLARLLTACAEREIGLPPIIALHVAAQVLRGLTALHVLKASSAGLGASAVLLSWDGLVKIDHVAGLEDRAGDMPMVAYLLVSMLNTNGPDWQTLGPEAARCAELVARTEPHRNDGLDSAREMLTAVQEALPRTPGLDLGVASLVRTAFVEDFARRPIMRNGPITRVSDERRWVCVLGGTTKRREQVAAVLMQRNIWVEAHAGGNTLRESLGIGKAPDAILVDVDLEQKGLDEALERARSTVPVLAFADSLHPAALERAHRLGALDLLFEPVGANRLAAGMRWATANGPRAGGRIRVLMMSADPKLAADFAPALGQLGYEVDLASGLPEAIMRGERASYHMVVCDMATIPQPPHILVGGYRGLPGMGQVPFLFLTETGVLESSIERSLTRQRGEAAFGIAGALERLLAESRQVRTFVRFGAGFAVEMIYGGRTVKGRALDVSRGGMMFQCEQTAPAGSLIALRLALDSSTVPVDVAARVTRTEHSRGMSVEFERFGGRGESVLIEHLRQLQG